MTVSAASESVTGLLGDLHAHRIETMDPAKLAVNINQRALLEVTADRDRFVREGDRIDSFDLPEVHGGRVVLDELLERGPVVLLFFRYAGCPACNIALPYYDRQLAPGLRELGATLVALSPQVPDGLAAIKDRHALSFLVASDVDNALGKQLGIVFTASDETQAASLANGRHLGEVIGTGTWELPMPTVVVIGQDHVVRFADVHPDWLVRTEADPILDAVRALIPAAAAG